MVLSEKRGVGMKSQRRRIVWGLAAMLLGIVRGVLAVGFTPTPTPDPNTFWIDHFEGTAGNHVSNWTDAAANASFNANICYSSQASVAAVTRTADSAWGKVLSPTLIFDVNEYSRVEVNVSGMTYRADASEAYWKIGIQEIGGAYRYWDLNTSSNVTGVFSFDIPAITGLSGTNALAIQLTVEGKSGTYIEADWVKVYRLVPPTPTATPTMTPTPNLALDPTPTAVDRWELDENRNAPAFSRDAHLVIFKNQLYAAWTEASAMLVYDGSGTHTVFISDVYAQQFTDPGWVTWDSWHGGTVNSPSGPCLGSGATGLFLGFNWSGLNDPIYQYDYTAGWQSRGTLNGGAIADAATSGSTPYVAWVISGYLYVFTQVGGTWQPMDQALNSQAGSSISGKIAISGSGVPYVTYADNGLICVKHWNGQFWAQDGNALNLNSSQIASSPAIAASLNNVYVAWQEPVNGASQVVVKTMSNGAWQQVGGSLNADPGNNASVPGITVSTLGVPYVIWVESPLANGVSDVFVKHWDGSTWQRDGNGLGLYNAYASTKGPVAIAVSQTKVFAAWNENATGPGGFLVVKDMPLDPNATRTATPTVTPTFTSTVTPTPTPLPADAWADDFTGTSGQQPTGWSDVTDEPTFNADITYATTVSLAAVTRTATGTWGKVLSPAIKCDTGVYNTVEVNVASLTADTSWKIGIQEVNGNWQYWDVSTSLLSAGMYNLNFAQVTGWTGVHTFQVQLTVEGAAGTGLTADWVRVCRTGTVHGASVSGQGGSKVFKCHGSPTPTTTMTISLQTTTPTVTPKQTLTPTITPVPNTPTSTPTRTCTPSPEPWAAAGTVTAYPNPARGRVQFAYTVSGSAKISIDIYRLTGERVAHIEERKDAGSGNRQTFTTAWEAAGVAPGVYFCRIVATDGAGHEVLNVKKKVALVR
jgi:hypothetical protein